MPKFSLRGLMAAFALMLGLSALATPALAQNSQTTNPNGTTTSCGTVCPGTTIWTVAGQAANGGIGESTFVGQTGTNKVEKRGWSIVDIQMAGEGCATLDCAQGASHFSAMIRAGEEVKTETTAQGNTSGQTVSATNGAQAIGIGVLQIQRLQGPPQATTNTGGHTQN